MIENSTLFQRAGVEITLVAEMHDVSAGQRHLRSSARALQSGIGGLVRTLKPRSAKRQCSRLEVVFAFR